MFSKRVSRGLRTKILRIADFRETHDVGKYLEVTLNGKGLRRKDYQYLMEQLCLKLSNWKTSNLSFTCQLTITKSVMQAVPIYPMMTYILPKGCLNEIQHIQSNFLWGDTMEKMKYHDVSWDMVTNHKDEGGLGLRKLEQMNKVCFSKLA
ncbi:unnamed protein product [Lathyrus sativus]|nr:unnamed protein product [Lathyrus sativus]